MSNKNKYLSNLLMDNKYDFSNGVFSFINDNTYTESFGLQWEKFRQVQLDSLNNTNISQNRFFNITQGFIENHQDIILEIGSGAGRFTEIIANQATNLVTMDLSTAIYANYKNNSKYDNTIFIRADAAQLPFKANTYDSIIMLGVIQHTQKPVVAFKEMVRVTKVGGICVVDFYRRTFSFITRINLRIVRFIIIHFIQDKNDRYNFVKKIFSIFYPIHKTCCRTKIGYTLITRISPIVTYFHDKNFLGISENDIKEWSLLDTHDQLTDRHKKLYSKNEIINLCYENELEILSLKKGGNGYELVAKKT